MTYSYDKIPNWAFDDRSFTLVIGESTGVSKLYMETSVVCISFVLFIYLLIYLFILFLFIYLAIWLLSFCFLFTVFCLFVCYCY